MIDLRIVSIQLTDGTIVACQLELTSVRPARIGLLGLVLHQQTFEADDVFDAVVLLREQLELLGARLLCMAARMDVYPSGMCRDMGDGRKACVMRLGESSGGDLVDIFAPIAASEVASVEQQERFFDDWFRSLTNR